MSTIKQITTKITSASQLDGNASVEVQRNGQTVTADCSLAILAQAVAALIEGGGGGGGDTTPPTVSSRTAIGPNTIRVDYNENVGASAAGHSFDVDGTDYAATAATAVDANTVDYTITGSMDGTSVVKHSYVAQGTGAGTRDTAGNQLAAFTDQDVTNDITDLEHQSTFTAANGTPIGSYTPEVGSAWSNYLGTMEIQGNKMVPASMSADLGGGFFVGAAIMSITKQDFTVKIRFTRLNPAKQMIFGLRRTSDGNFFVGGNIFLGQIQIAHAAGAGTFPVGQQTYNPTTNVNNTAEHLLEITVAGTTVTTKIDGETLSPAATIASSVNGLGIYVGFQDLSSGEVNDVEVV